jgi:hypothetical protein
LVQHIELVLGMLPAAPPVPWLAVALALSSGAIMTSLPQAMTVTAATPAATESSTFVSWFVRLVFFKAPSTAITGAACALATRVPWRSFEWSRTIAARMHRRAASILCHAVPRYLLR